MSVKNKLKKKIKDKKFFKFFLLVKKIKFENFNLFLTFGLWTVIVIALYIAIFEIFV
jgi:hypothetical protein